MLVRTEVHNHHIGPRTGKHRLPRTRQHTLDPLEDYSEVDSTDLESLLHDYSEGVAVPAHHDDEEPRTPRDDHETHERPREHDPRDRYAARGHANEFADTWMLK